MAVQPVTDDFDPSPALAALMGQDPEASKVVVKRVFPDREMLGAMSALGTMLTVRLLLAAAVFGVFLLSWQVLPDPSPNALWLLGGICILIIGPLIWLATKRV